MKFNASLTVMRNRCSEMLIPGNWYSMYFIAEVNQIEDFKNTKRPRAVVLYFLSQFLDYVYLPSKRGAPFCFIGIKEKMEEQPKSRFPKPSQKFINSLKEQAAENNFNTVYKKCIRIAIEDEQQRHRGAALDYRLLYHAYLGDYITSFFNKSGGGDWQPIFNQCLKASLHNMISQDLYEIGRTSSIVKKIYLLKNASTRKIQKATEKEVDIIETRLKQYRSNTRGYIPYDDFMLAKEEIENKLDGRYFLGASFEITFKSPFPSKNAYSWFAVRQKIYYKWLKRIEKELKKIKHPIYRDRCLLYFEDWKKAQISDRLSEFYKDITVNERRY